MTTPPIRQAAYAVASALNSRIATHHEDVRQFCDINGTTMADENQAFAILDHLDSQGMDVTDERACMTAAFCECREVLADDAREEVADFIASRGGRYRVIVNTDKGPLVVNDTPGIDDIAASFVAVEKARALGFDTAGVKSCKRTDV